MKAAIFDLMAPAYIDEARYILGRDKVVTSSQSCEVWDHSETGYSELLIPYSTGTLWDCRNQNDTVVAQWRLVFVLPLSIDQQTSRFKCPEDHVGLQSYAIWYEDWLSHWIHKQPEAGYYLIDFLPKYPHRVWGRQELEIRKKEQQASRVPEHIYTQSLISLAKVYNQDFYKSNVHWGVTGTICGRPMVLYSRSDGIRIWPIHSGFLGGNPATACLMRSSDF